MSEPTSFNDMTEATYDGQNQMPDKNEPKFSPAWLMIDISPDDKDRVQTWLVANGVSLNDCAGFDYYPSINMIRCRMYAQDSNGQHYMTGDGEPVWADPIEFNADGCPPIVTSCRALHSM